MTLHNSLVGIELHEPKNMSTTTGGATDIGKTLVAKGDGTSEVRKIKLNELDSGAATNRQIGVSDGAGAVTAQDSVRLGFWDYNDVATTATPIALTPVSTYVNLTNDELGANTLKTFALTGVTDVWDETVNCFDFSNLTIGDTVDIRIDITVTTTGANHQIELQFDVDQGGAGNYQLFVDRENFKSAGTYRIIKWYGLYVGDIPTRDGNHKIQVKSDTGAADTVTVNGWYVRATTRSNY